MEIIRLQRSFNQGKTQKAASRSRGGFTLIELLVVIAIVGVLGSLIFPALSRGKAMTKEVHCRNNLSQMSIAMSMYVDENDGVFPTFEWNPSAKRFNWEVSISGTSTRNGEGSGKLHCPTGRQGVMHETVPGKVFSFSASPTYGYNSFGYPPVTFLDSSTPSGLGGIKPDGAGSVIPTRESQLKNPAEMLEMGDGFRAKIDRKSGDTKLEESYYLGRLPNIGFPSFGDWTTTEGREEGFAPLRHRGRLNMVFCDGHVEGAKIERWYYSKDAEDLRRWRTDNTAP